MSVSAINQQAIQIVAQSEKTRGDIAMAVLVKQLDADKQQGQAAVQLIDQAAEVTKAAKLTRGIDVRA